MESDDRIIRQTDLILNGKRVNVSTVFLGIDHRFFDDGPPELFETMIFGGKHDNYYMERYCTYDEALIGHKEAIIYVLTNT